jgi:hypothetical protein
MLFDLKPKPVDPMTAPFVFGYDDKCAHQLPNGGSITADIAEHRGGWWWSARHAWNGGHDHPGVVDMREKAEAGRADTKAEALAACVAWMRGRL